MMSMVYEINYTFPDEDHETPRLRCLAAPRAVLLLPADAPAAAGRRAPALARAVPRPPPHRARAADPDGPARRNPCVRRLERHRPGRSPRIARPRAPSPFLGGPAGESIGPDPVRHAAPQPAPRPHDHPARHA